MSGSTVEQSTVEPIERSTQTREDTFRRKKASQLFKDIGGRGWLAGRMAGILLEDKRELDGISWDLGRMVAEAIMYMEREEIAGPDYRPYSSDMRKWASQLGSIFIGDRKVKVEHPRLRGARIWENVGFTVAS